MKSLIYLPWAAVQHLAIYGAVSIFDGKGLQAVIGIILFTLAHYPNRLLMALTFLLSSVFYTWYAATGQLLVAVSMLIIHATVATLLKKGRVEMRVLWKHPNWPKI